MLILRCLSHKISLIYGKYWKTPQAAWISSQIRHTRLRMHSPEQRDANSAPLLRALWKNFLTFLLTWLDRGIFVKCLRQTQEKYLGNLTQKRQNAARYSWKVTLKRLLQAGKRRPQHYLTTYEDDLKKDFRETGYIKSDLLCSFWKTSAGAPAVSQLLHSYWRVVIF